MSGAGARTARNGGAWIAGLVAAYLVLPLVDGGHGGEGRNLASHLGTALFAVLVGGTIATMVPWWCARTSRRVALLGVPLLGVALGLSLADVRVVDDVLLVVGAVPVGVLFARMPERLWHIVPAALVLAAADSWNVLVRHGVEKTPAQLVRAGSVAIPVPGLGYGAGPSLGVPDVVFWAMFVAVAVRFGLGRWRAALACGAALPLISIVQLEGGGGQVLPALPFIGGCFVIAMAPALWRDVRGGQHR